MVVLIHNVLYNTIVNTILPKTGISENQFFVGLSSILNEFHNRNDSLLKKRDAIQALIDSYHLNANKNGIIDPSHYASFLTQIGYLAPQSGPDNFKVQTENVDDEIKSIPGPQLVVPVDNARYALNAANARWGSLMDAYYGTDAGPSEADGCERGSSYNPKRGKKVFEYTHKFLDSYFPLARGFKYSDVIEFLLADNGKRLVCKLTGNDDVIGLDTESKFVGYQLSNDKKNLSSILLLNNNLHVEILIDRNDPIGKGHIAGIKDVVLESAITAIADCEDSVAAVDAEDKAKVYSNWAGIMNGTLNEKFIKGKQTLTRTLRPDKIYINSKNPQGPPLILSGRVCMLVRNVGLHMYTDAVLTPINKGSRQVPEGIVDAMVTTLAAMHDLAPENITGKPRNLINSKKGSMYIVKPKMHGPEEVKFTCDLITKVEKIFGLKENTIKIGIMDEERRTTVNLKECIRAAQNRVIFINTGFLDRTGDEIHTSFYAGPVLPKELIKKAVWRNAYEDWNVDIGASCGVAQIGKGMWAAPDAMADMIKQKGEHPKSGANTAWVPSPTAATLHALHYHETNVFSAQAVIISNGQRATLSKILTPPLLGDKKLTSQEITFELENNIQGILGYVVRWIELGVGCSKVPDLHDIGLMEDRATLRISSQHIANWLYHGIVSKEQIISTFEKMAIIVDKQNEGSGGYEPMSPKYNNLAYECALELVFRGANTANGLTEYTLTEYRRKEKLRRNQKSSKL